MDIKQDVIAAIGNTPLIKLRKASELTGCTILGKAEFMNPGQSVKDRAASRAQSPQIITPRPPRSGRSSAPGRPQNPQCIAEISLGRRMD